MPAFGGKADMMRTCGNVRFAPKADTTGKRSCTDNHLEHAHPVPDLYFQMDRANAIRLLKALTAGGMDTRAPRQIHGTRRKHCKLDWKATSL